jgi:hypothetical protein
MEDQNTERTWEPMDVEESGHIGEVMQGEKKISPIARGPAIDLSET